MNLVSTTDSRWVVSTRTHGEVLAAGVATPTLELVLLGIPAGFATAVVEGWLRDLGSIASEDSRADDRVRAIPALLHRALTGLLFAQAEIWSRVPGNRPVSAAFAESPECGAFGWVGEGRVQVLIDGVPFEPNWVRVRDEEGREARAASFPANAHVTISLEWWPDGDTAAAAPASLEAEWSPTRIEPAVAISVPLPAPAAEPEAPAESAAMLASVPPLPETLPAHQPGLAEPARGEAAPADAAVVAAASAAFGTGAEETQAAADSTDAHAAASEHAVRAVHPIGRWLGRVMSWGRKADKVREPEFIATEATPVSTYDALLSESVPASPDALPAEQTAIELHEDAGPEPGPEVSPAPSAVIEVVEQAELTAAPARVGPPTLSAAGLTELLGAYQLPAASRAPAAPEPVLRQSAPPLPVAAVPAEPPVAEPASVSITPAGAAGLANVDPSALPVLSPRLPAEVSLSDPIAVVHEPIGAHDTFAIPRVPVRPAPGGPPMLRVTPPVTPVSATPPPSGPPALPPVLRIPAPESAHVPPAAAGPAMNAAGESPLLEIVHDLAPDGAIETVIARPPAIARPVWPDFQEPPAQRAWFRRPWPWLALILVVFGAGWLLGGQQQGDRNAPGPFVRALRAVGLGGARFTAAVNSTPTGAWIALDGKDLAVRTPANLELPPGEHTLTLTLPDLGAVQLPLRGRNGERVTVEESLNGELDVLPADSGVPIRVALDGKPQGYAPVKIESLAPGLHEVQFSGPGMPAWAQTVQIGVRKTAELIAHPMSAPGTGVIQVQATLNDETGSSPLSGAQVRVDGEPRGNTPLKLELPRGPHSLKVSWHGETAPVQVIELPGGNERHASFGFGLDTQSPTISLGGMPRVIAAGQATTVTATLSGLQPREVREAWLHVRAPEGLWRRYPMTMLAGPGSAIVVSVFPLGTFDAQGQTRWYVSAATLQGDEYFSEMQSASQAGAAHASAGHPAIKP